MAYDCKLIECYPGFGPELTTDGNMENDPTTNWPTGGGGPPAVAWSALVHGGCFSLRLTDVGAGGDYAYQDITVEAGHRYRIGVWGYATAGDEWRVRIYAGGTVRWTSDTHNAAAWEEEVKFYRVPDGITTIQLWLQAVNAADVVYFDDVSVKREYPVPMTEIDLHYPAVDDWALLLDQGISINDPAVKEVWGGELEDQLVRREYGKRVIPMELALKADDADTLIDDVNGLEAMLQHAATFRMEGKASGLGETFLQFKTDGATHYVWYPVIAGRIDKQKLMSKRGTDKEIGSIPVMMVCEAYWESPFTYDLFNVLDNPGFEEWNAGICDAQPDCWADDSNITAGTGTNNQETDMVEEGCEALRIEVADINNTNRQGVNQRIETRLRADTEYTLLAWVQNAAITNGTVIIGVYSPAGGWLAYALNSSVAYAQYTRVSCQFTPTAANIAANVYVNIRIMANADHCYGIAHIDKMLVMESSNVPTGWMSSSYLVNHYDRDAGDINYLSVCDVPGEVEAEAAISLVLGDALEELFVAKRTCKQPANFIWELLAADAVVTAGDAACKDTTLVGDGTAPGGQHVRCTFAGTQTMADRCYWDISTNLADYTGQFAIAVLAAKTDIGDDITMQLGAMVDLSFWNQGRKVGLGVTVPAVHPWELVQGWDVLSFPIGPHDDDLWGAGDFWRISILASIGAAPVGELRIAGAYVIPLNESYLAGGISPTSLAAGVDLKVKCMDGDRGIFPHGSATNRYYGSLGCVGSHPLLTPEIENWLYFILADYTTPEVDITDTATASIQYRPRGLFLRGSNP